VIHLLLLALLLALVLATLVQLGYSLTRRYPAPSNTSAFLPATPHGASRRTWLTKKWRWIFFDFVPTEIPLDPALRREIAKAAKRDPASYWSKRALARSVAALPLLLFIFGVTYWLYMLSPRTNFQLSPHSSFISLHTCSLSRSTPHVAPSVPTSPCITEASMSAFTAATRFENYPCPFCDAPSVARSASPYLPVNPRPFPTLHLPSLALLLQASFNPEAMA
jgi:hypothetical protein